MLHRSNIHKNKKKIHVYVPPEDVNQFISDLHLKEIPTGENIRIIIPHDKTPCMFSNKRENDLVTSPAQTVLDLLSGIGRGEEAAEAIIEEEYVAHG